MSICIQNNNKGLLSCSEPQGIGSILGFDQCDKRSPKTTIANSLRRTLSADMSSKNWLTQHGFSPLKKIASSEELQIEVISEEDQKEETVLEEQPGQFDIWCSILSQKPSSLPPPYVHPLVKRSKSSLTGKSLQICTENLGSESGSDGFSSYSPSEISSDEEQEEDVVVVVEEAKHQSSQVVDEVVCIEKEEMGIVNYNCPASRKSSSSAPRSFPPPLPSLSKPGGLHMRPHRKDGRLVLEAVSVPVSQNYFHAQRQDGRLLLTFINPSQQSTQKDDQEEEVDNHDEIVVEEFELSYEEDGEKEEEGTVLMMEEEREFVLEAMKVPKLPTGVINVHRSALMVNKFMGLTNTRNPTWSDHHKKLEKMVHDHDEDYQEENSTKSLFPQSLPSPPPPPLGMTRLMPTPPPPSLAASFNTYDYCWRRQSSTVVSVNGIHHPLINNQQQQSLPNTQKNYCNYKSYIGSINSTTTTTNHNHNHNHNNHNFLVIKDSLTSSSSRTTTKKADHQNVVILSSGGEKADHLVPYLRSCKEPRRSLLIWEPYCIATS